MFQTAASTGPLSLFVSMSISDIRGDAIAVERNIPASHKSLNSNINENMTMQCNKLIFSYMMNVLYEYQYQHLWK